MMKITRLLILLALLIFAETARASGTLQSFNSATAPSTGTTAYIGQTVGTSASTVLAKNQVHVYLMLMNPSAAGGNTLSCAFGTTAVANAAGDITIAPGQSYTWEGSYAPVDAISCISSGASTPLTIGVQ